VRHFDPAYGVSSGPKAVSGLSPLCSFDSSHNRPHFVSVP
jgi:hypothetical protein